MEINFSSIKLKWVGKIMISNTDKEDWWEIWQHHLSEYLKSVPRAGIFINEYFPSVRKILEVACGSSKDSIYLAKKGFLVIATDYEKRLINYLKERFRYPNLLYLPADAFKLPFKDDAFDLVFHNGFFVLFNKNEDIYELLKEQARVSKKFILFFVHNKLNSNLVQNFSKLALSDRLYKIRFFEPKEVLEIINHSEIKPRVVKIMKFGGPFDVFFSKKSLKLLYPLTAKIIPKLYQIQAWEKTERIACLIELNKK